jgi:simple sugar transport system permease protein
VVALSGVLAAKLLATGWSGPSVMLVVLLLGAALGLTMGMMIHFLELQPFVVTLAGMFLARGLCYVISVESIPIRDPLFTAIAQGTVSLPGDTFVSPSVVIAILVVLVGAYLLHTTRFGRTVYAIGGNQQSAELMGLRVGRTKVAVYGISGLCSAIGGLLFAFYSLSGYSLSAVGTELDAIAATVIGGTLLSGGVGLVVGSVLGVLVLGLIQTFISFEGTLSSWWTRIVIGGLLLVFVVLQRFLVRRPSAGG